MSIASEWSRLTMNTVGQHTDSKIYTSQNAELYENHVNISCCILLSNNLKPSSILEGLATKPIKVLWQGFKALFKMFHLSWEVNPGSLHECSSQIELPSSEL